MGPYKRYADFLAAMFAVQDGYTGGSSPFIIEHATSLSDWTHTVRQDHTTSDNLADLPPTPPSPTDPGKDHDSLELQVWTQEPCLPRTQEATSQLDVNHSSRHDHHVRETTSGSWTTTPLQSPSSGAYSLTTVMPSSVEVCRKCNLSPAIPTNTTSNIRLRLLSRAYQAWLSDRLVSHSCTGTRKKG